LRRKNSRALAFSNAGVRKFFTHQRVKPTRLTGFVLTKSQQNPLGIGDAEVKWNYEGSPNNKSNQRNDFD
jgi:hypothetical protein